MSARDAYALWATTYGPENPVTTLDAWAVDTLTPALDERRLLDAGCGTARRLRDARAAGASLAVGVDLVEAMLRRGRAGATDALAAGDVRALPFESEAFDVVWCRLVLGHLPELVAAYAELARVLAPGGTLVVTDFHPAAARAGHTRTFRAPDGAPRTVEHHLHEPEEHVRTAHTVGLSPGSRLDAAVGPLVRAHYREAVALDRYARDEGLPLVLALSFRK